MRAGSRRALGTTAGLVGLVLAIVGCGVDPRGEPERANERADGEGATGLRFDALPPVSDADVAPLEDYPARDGVRLPLRHYASDRAPASLVLIHGSGTHGRYLAPLARRISAARAARVYTPDLRGHGASPERRGDCDYVDQLEDDLADLVRLVRERHPGSRVAVGGHSSGGGLAVRFAGSDHRGEADGYLLLAPFLGHDAPTTRPASGGWARPRIPVIVVLSILNGFGVTAWNGATAITFAMPEAVRDGTETLAYSYRLNTGYAPRDYARDLAGLEAPLLALIGADDEAFLPEQLAPTLRAVTELDAEVEVLPGVGHLDLPSAPATAARMIDWLESLP